MNLTPFKSLKFGEAAAEDEAEKNPKLFKKSFMDPWGVVDQVQDGEVFLLIGPKGVGKSTVVEYLKIKGQEEQAGFRVDSCDLGSLHQSVAAEKKIGEESENGRTELAWTVFLWLKLFESVMNDLGSDISRDPDYVDLHNKLKRSGLVDGEFRTVIREVRKRTHKFTLPKRIYEFQREDTGSIEIHANQLASVLENAVIEAETEATHVLALDGLDSAIIGSESYWNVLSNLLRAAYSMHRKLRRARSRIRILLLCRSDIFMKINLPDSNKIRQGWAIEFTWEYGNNEAESSYLWDLVEKKARAGGGKFDNILLDYLPPEMIYGKNVHRPMHSYLMNLTRQTPRDILMLFRNISKSVPFQENHRTLSVKEVRAGVNNYCKSYFANEILNELAGLTPHSVASATLGILGSLDRRFQRSDFEKAFSEIIEKNNFTIDQLLHQLFLAGAIANIKRGREEYIQFYHRRNLNELNASGPFLLHPALALAVNAKF
ncbi:hypothetical protein NI17_016950 [Thermobifida halotolerans]|uniref:Uncharacterized protein n=1 Tax=Thermobifida halotolerans TaxID=483545 RepID=A0AA97LUW2_9ACTN|nr:hypothetical protein [Thermobifida halotolerans]UOE18499.1 hypothetical protein NI17_016950 [Thermobifida halotolerans]